MPSTQEVIVVNPASTSVVVVSGTAVGPQGIQGIQGPTGATGPTPVISATASTLPVGSTATATVSGPAATPTISFGIPTGATGSTGATGATPVITATATTLPVGSTATANATGPAATPTITFGIPTGATGLTGIVISSSAPVSTSQLWADTTTNNAQVAVFDGGTPTSQITSIKIRRGLSTAWTTQILDSGEIGFETDTRRFKVGNGTTGWSGLSYAKGDIPDSPTINNPTLTGTINMTGATITGGIINGGSA